MSIMNAFDRIRVYFQRNSSLLWLLGITLLGAVTRLYGIIDLPFTDDELSVESRLHYASFAQLIQQGVLCEGHPAGVQVLIWYWSKLFGYSELALRFPFLLMGIACIPLVYIVAKKWFNQQVGLFVAAYFAVSQYIIFHSVVARPYIPGLFFALIMLWYWSKIIFDADYTWKNMIMMGILGALCAYTHQFSMFFAFILGISGVFFVHKKYIWKYIIGCLLAMVLYLPHVPILLLQIKMGGVGGSDGWLGKPTPEFFIMYPKYIFHFSRYVYLIVALIIGFYFIKNIRLWKTVFKKQLLASILFLIPLLTAYFYSIYVNPVLQFNILIFAFPFLLFVLFSMIDEKSDILKKIFLVLMMGAMLYSLVYQRKHYVLMNQQWFELSAKKAIECKKTYGEKQLSVMLNMEMPFLHYYERKYNEHIDNLVYKEYSFTEKSFYSLLEHQQSDYLLAAGLTDVQVCMIKEKYPYILYCEKCFTSEILLFSKHPSSEALIFKPLYYHQVNYDTNTFDSTVEFIPIDAFRFIKINDSRYTLINVALEYVSSDTNADVFMVLETKYKDSLMEWRAIETKNLTRIANQKQYIYIPLRYELLFKNSRKMKDVSVNVYLWNPNKTSAIKFLNASVTAYKDNEYLYGLVECLQ